MPAANYSDAATTEPFLKPEGGAQEQDRSFACAPRWRDCGHAPFEQPFDLKPP